MTNIFAQEVWFAEFPFAEDETKSKNRPVIVLDVDDETCMVLSTKVTSSEPYSEFEIEIFDWADVPLDHKSTAGASNVRQIPKSNFRRRIGKLSDDDWDNVTDLYYHYLRHMGYVD